MTLKEMKSQLGGAPWDDPAADEITLMNGISQFRALIREHGSDAEINAYLGALVARYDASAPDQPLP